MKRRNYNNHAVLEVKIDYVESKLDETVKSFKEALGKSELKLDESIRNLKETFKETIEKSEARLEADRRATEIRLENERLAAERRLAEDRKESEARLAEDRKEFEARLAEERKESRATRRALNANFIAAIVLIVTVIGLLITVVNGSLAL